MAARTVRSGEFDLIARYFKPLAAGRDGAFGLTDDAALLGVSDGADRIVTTDALVEGIHFRPDDPPDRVARKALRVNLSDLAAMGAAPESTRWRSGSRMSGTTTGSPPWRAAWPRTRRATASP